MKLSQKLPFAIVVALSVFRQGAEVVAKPEPRTAPDLASVVRAVQAEHGLKGAEVAVSVIDVESGQVLAEANEHTPLNPASNAKVVTAAAALALLHGDYQYETTLSGAAHGDTITGGVVLRGYGDPSLDTGAVADLVGQLRARGIRKIDGDILVDQRFFDEQTTPPAFDQQPSEWSYFRAPVSAVAVNRNCVTLTVRAAETGAPAHVSFDPPGFVDTEGAVMTSDDRADIVLALEGTPDKRLHAKLGGGMPASAGLYRETKRVEDPSLLAGYVLKEMLERGGIHAPGAVKLGSLKRKPMAIHKSAPLSTLLYALGKASDNFYAEMVFKTLGGEIKGRPSHAVDAADAVTTWLDKIGANDTGVVIKNGSGLFDANRLTTSTLTRVLRAAWKDPTIQPEFVAQLSIGGVDGTLEHRFRNEHTRRLVRAKTGTLDDSVALTGYVFGTNGQSPVAFSILFNHVTGKHDIARKAADRIVEAIARR